MNSKDFRPRLKGDKKIAYDNLTTNERRILVIGDIHAPFELEGYLEFCQETYAKHLCNQVVFIGDIIDNHYTSYHETSSDGLGGADELHHAIEVVNDWKKAFPVADVIIGNHDRMVMRKAQTSDIPSVGNKMELGRACRLRQCTVHTRRRRNSSYKSEERYDVYSAGTYPHSSIY